MREHSYLFAAGSTGADSIPTAIPCTLQLVLHTQNGLDIFQNHPDVEVNWCIHLICDSKGSSAMAFDHRSLLAAQERILVEPDRDMVQHFATEALAAELL